jgi:hypothetical protein
LAGVGSEALEKVSAEMSLHVLAYNLKRMTVILGRLSPSPYENLHRRQTQPCFRAAPA